MLNILGIKHNPGAIDFLKPTQASCAYDLWKRTLDWNIYKNEYVQTEQYIRQAYKGGFCCCYKLGKIKGPIKYYDINSLYPSVMMEDFPIYPPQYSPMNRQYINDFRTIENDLKIHGIYSHYQVLAFEYKDNVQFCFIPERIKQSTFYFQKGQNLKHTWISHQMLMYIYQDLKSIHLIGVLRYQLNYQPIFKKYIDTLYKQRSIAKQNNDKLGQIRIKTLMNALYGKMAQNIDSMQDMISRQYKNLLDDAGATSFYENEYLDAYILELPVKEQGSLCYLALEIAARARLKLVKGIYQNKNNVLYCDTDSMFLTGDVKGILVDDNILGAWKDEKKGYIIDDMFIFSPKVYVLNYRKENSQESIQEVKMKGLNQNYTDFNKQFNELQNAFGGSFNQQIVWSRQLGFVRQNNIQKKMEHRIRRYTKQNGDTRPFYDRDEYERYFRKRLIIWQNQFLYIDKKDEQKYL